MSVKFSINNTDIPDAWQVLSVSEYKAAWLFSAGFRISQIALLMQAKQSTIETLLERADAKLPGWRRAGAVKWSRTISNILGSPAIPGVAPDDMSAYYRCIVTSSNVDDVEAKTLVAQGFPVPHMRNEVLHDRAKTFSLMAISARGSDTIVHVTAFQRFAAKPFFQETVARKLAKIARTDREDVLDEKWYVFLYFRVLRAADYVFPDCSAHKFAQLFLEFVANGGLWLTYRDALGRYCQLLEAAGNDWALAFPEFPSWKEWEARLLENFGAWTLTDSKEVNLEKIVDLAKIREDKKKKGQAKRRRTHA